MTQPKASRLDLARPLLAVENAADMHPREAEQPVVLALLRATDGKLRDDATAMCIDWHGGPPRERTSDSGAID